MREGFLCVERRYETPISKCFSVEFDRTQLIRLSLNLNLFFSPIDDFPLHVSFSLSRQSENGPAHLPSKTSTVLIDDSRRSEIRLRIE